MFKKIIITTALVAVVGVLVYGAVYRTVARSESEGTGLGGYGRGRNNEVTSAEQTDISFTEGQGNGGQGRGRGAGSNSGGGYGTGAYSAGTNGAGIYGAGELYNLPAADPAGLSAEESAALLYMREEEKLAHDVYLTLYAKWGLPIFQNISQSEQKHSDAVKELLDRYGLSDPASSSAGVFTNPELQKLYNELVARGSQSLSEAIQVGALIEEVDILDLQERLAQNDNADVEQVFNNLLKGSYNHLRSFTSTLEKQTGETYQPQYLSAEAYQSIIGAGAGNGGNGGGNSGRGGGNGSGNSQGGGGNGGGNGRRGGRS